MYRNAANWGLLVLYPASLLNFQLQLILYGLEYFACKSILSMKQDYFTPSFPICKLFIYFSCLVNLVSTSSTTLKSSGKSRPPCLVPNLRGKAFSLSPLSMMCVCVCVCVCVKWLSMSDSLRPHGLQPARLLCPWDSPGKNTGVDCHFLLQGIFPTQGSNLSLLRWRQKLYPLSHRGSP